LIVRKKKEEQKKARLPKRSRKKKGKKKGRERGSLASNNPLSTPLFVEGGGKREQHHTFLQDRLKKFEHYTSGLARGKRRGGVNSGPPEKVVFTIPNSVKKKEKKEREKQDVSLLIRD